MPRRKWTREVFILALNLYLKMPFGKMHKSNPEVKKLARLIDRSDNSVALRLVNFAACDPKLQARGIRGMQSGKKQCQPFWDEFSQNPEELMFESEKILASLQQQSIEQKYQNIIGNANDLQGFDKIQLIKSRVNQDVFRQMLLCIYDYKCALTGIENTDLLLASHIIPWSENTEERLNPRNGICLSALYDKAFDKGLITFDEEYRTVLSTELKDYSTKDYYSRFFGSVDGKKLSMTYDDYLPEQMFLDYHRNNIFRG